MRLFFKDYLQKLIAYLTECYAVDQKSIKIFFLVNTSIMAEIGAWDKNGLFHYWNRSNTGIF